MKYYIYSGSLKGVGVDAPSPFRAVQKVVKEHAIKLGECVLGSRIRVSSRKSNVPHILDCVYQPPYEKYFPELFNGEFDVRVVPVEKYNK